MRILKSNNIFSFINGLVVDLATPLAINSARSFSTSVSVLKIHSIININSIMNIKPIRDFIGPPVSFSANESNNIYFGNSKKSVADYTNEWKNFHHFIVSNNYESELLHNLLGIKTDFTQESVKSIFHECYSPMLLNNCGVLVLGAFYKVQLIDNKYVIDKYLVTVNYLSLVTRNYTIIRDLKCILSSINDSLWHHNLLPAPTYPEIYLYFEKSWVFNNYLQLKSSSDLSDSYLASWPGVVPSSFELSSSNRLDINIIQTSLDMDISSFSGVNSSLNTKFNLFKSMNFMDKSQSPHLLVGHILDLEGYTCNSFSGFFQKKKKNSYFYTRTSIHSL